MFMLTKQLSIANQSVKNNVNLIINYFVSVENSVYIYNLADEYDVPVLRDWCERFINDLPISDSTTLFIADACRKTEVVNRILGEANLPAMFEEITKREFLVDLSSPTVLAMMVSMKPYLQYVNKYEESFNIDVGNKSKLQ